MQRIFTGSRGGWVTRVARLLALLALLQICGGHWIALQTVAWVGMFVRSAEAGAPWKDALQNTFDGAHPCELCKRVSSGHKSEQREQVKRVTVKIEGVLPVAGVSVGLRRISRRHPERGVTRVDWIAGVPTPPPREG